MSCKECARDYVSTKHYKNKKCHICKSTSFSTSQVCGCLGQCGCQIGITCDNCGTIVMPPKGEGYCHAVRNFRIMVKDQKAYGRCAKPGCQKLRKPGKDYCCWNHAQADGN